MSYKLSTFWLYLIVLIVSTAFVELSVQSANVHQSNIYLAGNQIVQSDSVLLTKQKVKGWMQTRIAVAKLQKQMKNNTTAYEDVAREFYAKRVDLLQSKGWSVYEFDIIKERIHAAISAMDMAEELEESRGDHEKEIANIRGSKFYSKEQKQELIDALSKVREQKRAQFIEPTKPDWPAIKPFRTVFREMTSWIAGNSSTIPIIE